MKVYICCKTLSKCIPIQKSALKNQKPIKPYIIAQGDHRETIKVIKSLRVKYAPATGISLRVKYAPATGIAKGTDIICLLVRHGTITDIGYQWVLTF